MERENIKEDEAPCHGWSDCRIIFQLPIANCQLLFVIDSGSVPAMTPAMTNDNWQLENGK